MGLELDDGIYNSVGNDSEFRMFGIFFIIGPCLLWLAEMFDPVFWSGSPTITTVPFATTAKEPLRRLFFSGY